MKYTCLVVDDNPIERDVLSMHLRKSGLFHVLEACDGAKNALLTLGKEEVDVVYCDIDMGEFSGIELLKSLKKPPVFVFVTSFEEYAAESYKIDAFDFIVKPATAERVHTSAKKVIAYLDLKKLADRYLTENLTEIPSDTSDYFFIRENHEITRLQYSEVHYMESMGDFTIVHTEGRKHITLVNLKNMEAQLPSNKFRRIHKQYIINLSHIQTIGQNHVVLRNQQQIPISLANRQEFLGSYVEEKTITRFKK